MLMIALAVRSGRVMSFDLRAIVPLLPWGAVAVMAAIGFVLGGGYDLSATIALVSVVVVSYFAVENPNWILPAVKVFIGVLLIFALATIACYVAPQLYTGFIKPTFYSNVPMAMDYRSGLASHYSHNGTFCTIGLMLASSMSFYGSESSSAKRFYGILALIFFIALVLTTKRAHLLCGIFAIGFVYLLSGNSHKYLKAIGVTVLMLLAVAILAPLVPGVEATIERLNSTFSSGTSFEDNVNNRTFLWNYALNGLSQAPLFGHGWTSYCYRWPDGFTITYMAHNELLNLLYETGFFWNCLGSCWLSNKFCIDLHDYFEGCGGATNSFSTPFTLHSGFLFKLCVHERSSIHNDSKPDYVFLCYRDNLQPPVEFNFPPKGCVRATEIINGKN